MERFQFAKSSDGVRIAISTLGSGPPAVMIPFWFSFMPIERQMPPARAFFEGAFRGRLQVYYDKRGIGLSDRSPPDFSLDALVSDLETVTDFLGLSQFVLFGPGDGGCVAIVYAARHPERVSHVILYGAYRSLEGISPLLEALVALMSVEWDLAAQAMAQLANPSRRPHLRPRPPGSDPGGRCGATTGGGQGVSLCRSGRSTTQGFRGALPAVRSGVLV
jgi:pimeloyl-ACP methyl ester carboxylesterase